MSTLRSDPAAGAAGLAAGVLLASAPIGDGGNAASTLLFHQTLVAAAVVVIAGLDAGPLLRRSRALPWILGGALGAWMLAPNRYRAMLLLTNLVVAALVWTLSAIAAARPTPRRWVLAGLLTGASLVVAVVLAEWAVHREPHGLYRNPRHAAALATAALAAIGARSLLPGVENRRRVLLWLWAAPIAAAVVVLTSRGAFVGLAVGGATLVLLTRRLRLLLTVAVLLAAVVAIPSPLSARLHIGSGDLYRFERVRIWAAAARMGLDHMWQGGVGIGSFERVARRYNFPVEGAVGRFAKYPNHAHNEALQLFAEASLPGLLVCLLPLLAVLRRARALARENAATASLAIPAAVGVAAMVGHAMVDAVLHAPANLYALAGAGGLVSGLAMSGTAPPPGPPPSWWRSVRWPLAILWLSLWLGAALLPWAGDRSYQRFAADDDEFALDRAILLVPGHPGYHVARAARAGARFRAGGPLADLDRARREFEAGVALDPNDSRVWRHLAAFEHQCFLERAPSPELAERALAHYRRALDLDPSNPFLMLERTALLGALRRSSEAEQGALEATELEPNFRAGWEALARVREQRGDAAGARLAASRAAAIAARFPDPERIRSPYESALVGGTLSGGIDASPREP